MYEETISGLRKIVHDYKGRLTPYMRLTICEAADAIEELSDTLKAYQDGTDMIVEEAPGKMAVRFERKWLPVTEKPPLKVGDDGYNGYLVLANGFCEVADYTVDESGALCFFVDGEYEPDVTHFMPIPELPKLDGGRGNV